MDKLLSILKEIRPDVDFSATDSLMDSGTLDSFDIVAIIGEISSAFDIQVPVEAISSENFNSAQAMQAMIQRIQAEG